MSDQNTTRVSLGTLEAEFLTQVGPIGIFSLQDAGKILGPAQKKYARQFLARLWKKGWIERIRPGLYAVIPLSSGETRTPQIHEFVIAMELIKPAAISFLSAMNYHGLTEQVPREVLVATDHKVNRPRRESAGFVYRIVSVSPARFYGLTREWINEKPFMITDMEKTLIDGLAMPEYTGGIGTVAQALSESWARIDEKRLYDHAVRMGVSAVVKRLGFLLESLTIGNPEQLRKMTRLSPGFSRLDPTLPKSGKYNRRWGLLVNAQVRP